MALDPTYTPPADGASDSADPLFRPKLKTCGRCGDEFTTSARWRYFCRSCRQSTEVKNPAANRTVSVSSGRRSGGA